MASPALKTTLLIDRQSNDNEFGLKITGFRRGPVLDLSLLARSLLLRGPRIRKAAIIVSALLQNLCAQTSFTWQQIKDKFEAQNPTLKAAQLNIDESRAAEITAYLRPNPDFSLTADGFQISRNMGVWRPFSGVVETPAISYLHEREHKRELRRDQAKESTAIAESTYLDQERSLVFNLQS